MPNSREGRQFRESINSLPTGKAVDCLQGLETAGFDGSSGDARMPAEAIQRFFNSVNQLKDKDN